MSLPESIISGRRLALSSHLPLYIIPPLAPWIGKEGMQRRLPITPRHFPFYSSPLFLLQSKEQRLLHHQGNTSHAVFYARRSWTSPVSRLVHAVSRNIMHPLLTDGSVVPSLLPLVVEEWGGKFCIRWKYLRSALYLLAYLNNDYVLLGHHPKLCIINILFPLRNRHKVAYNVKQKQHLTIEQGSIDIEEFSLKTRSLTYIVIKFQWVSRHFFSEPTLSLDFRESNPKQSIYCLILIP